MREADELFTRSPRNYSLVTLMKLESKGRGFTLIELLVVIAIIGILSSVVLASLNTARAKGSDAKVKSELAAFSTNAELLYDTQGQTYAATETGTCPSALGSTLFSTTSAYNIVKDVKTVAKGGTVACAGTASAYAFQAQLNDQTNGAYFCVDSTGRRATSSSALGSATVCP